MSYDNARIIIGQFSEQFIYFEDSYSEPLLDSSSN